ncbi:hypothetical protein FHW69_001893 [Luteibacter sp. Sphag1AF]|uniref:hypothetical protein n=1 Tax=Luteibacter sp. Sphag1AF TaxID=2587031 RepID=UPI00161402BD|nr:hypothetical protein [Luteibacter sp. Sphag1AF]MBB3227292.1 hypothetical protein [Luteibacter sp. Sphag1AF]
MRSDFSGIAAGVRDALSRVDSALVGTGVSEVIVIGSAAALLAGADVEVADIDLLTSVEDAIRIESAWSAWHQPGYVPGDGGRFRSRFSRYAWAGMPVEVMGGLEVAVDGHWQNVAVSRSRAVDGLRHIRVASVTDQRALLALFGRPKDDERAHALLHVLADA